MSAFDAEADEAQAATDEAFADGFAFAPYARPPKDRTADEAPDPSRAAIDFVIVIYRNPPAVSGGDYAWDRREHTRPGLSTGQPRLDVSAPEIARLTTLLGVPFVVQPGDRFTRLDGGEAYRVMDVNVAETGLVRLAVNRLA